MGPVINKLTIDVETRTGRCCGNALYIAQQQLLVVLVQSFSKLFFLAVFFIYPNNLSVGVTRFHAINNPFSFLRAGAGLEVRTM